MAVGNILDAAYLRRLLNYDQETGVFRWLISPGNNFVSAGQTTGCVQHKGYMAIKIDGRLYKAHRLAWLYVTGEWPPDQIDHRNGDPKDNSWKNLRLATNAQNARNRRPRVDKLKGAYWHKRIEKWQAVIIVNYKRIHLGSFDTEEEAHRAYWLAAQAHFGEFARAA